MKTEIAVILDRSGSMEKAKDDHEGGLNSFIREQKELEGDVYFTFLQFDDVNPCEVIYLSEPIEQVGPITLTPRGRTPLLDAVGRGIQVLSARILREYKPDMVIVMVITDGLENASREYTKVTLRKEIEKYEKKGWKFLFLGANIDSWEEAKALGLDKGTTMDFANASSMYGSISHNVRSANRAFTGGQTLCSSYDQLSFTPEQRKEALNETVSSSSDLAPDKETKGRRRRSGNVRRNANSGSG